MSNRNLAITIVIIALLGIATLVGLKTYHSSKNSVQGNSAQSNSNANQQVASNSNTSTNTNTAVNNQECVRNFDQSKLQTAVTLKNQFVTLEVKDYGTIKIQLYDQDAPKTVENFLKLTNSGFYDCLIFHRVAKGFVIQTGDPKGDGTGGQSAFGGEFADELNANSPSYKAGYTEGVVAMANRGANTNTSQFFITLADLNANLPKNYTIFGKVVDGMDVVQKIGQVDINPGPFGPTDGTPKVPVVITKATIVK